MVPFGLAQAPAYFQALISMVLEGLSHFAIAYLDDIIIFSKNKEENLQYLEIIFKRLLSRTEVEKVKIQFCENAHGISGPFHFKIGHRTNVGPAISYQGDASTQKPQRNQTVFRTCRILSKIHTEVFRHSQTIN